MLEDVCDGTSDISDVLVSKRDEVRGHHSRGLAIFGLDMRKSCVRNSLAEAHRRHRSMSLAARKNRAAVQQKDTVHTPCQYEFRVLRFTCRIVARIGDDETVAAGDQRIRDPAEDAG